MDFKSGGISSGRLERVPAVRLAVLAAALLLQVNEVATATMMAARGATYPVFELMHHQERALERDAFLPAIAGYYSDAGGNLAAFPFNASTPVLYYDKDLFRSARLDANTAIAQITFKPPTENSLGLPLGSFVLVRDAIEDELEEAFAGRKTAKAALDSAVVRGNEMLRQFERATR